MGYARAGLGEQCNAGFIQVNAVGKPDIFVDPAHFFRKFCGRHAIAFLTEGEIFPVFRGGSV